MKDLDQSDATLMFGGASPLNNWEDHRVIDDDAPRPFRRRSALRRAEQAMPMEEPRAKLPAKLPPVWDRLRRARPTAAPGPARRRPLVSYFRDDPVAGSFDQLRTRLSQAIRQRGWKRIAIAAPTRGCGATFTAVNLALSLARVPGSRTILMDLNQRDPGISEALGLRGFGDTPAFLTGDLPPEGHLVKYCDNLALGLMDDPSPSVAAERLHGAACAEALNRTCDLLNPDVVLYDLPAILSHDDFTAFLPQVDAVLLVSDATRTTAAQISACEDLLEGHAELLGVVLNRARDNGLAAGDA